MVDPKNLTDENLERRYSKAHNRDDRACIISALCFIGCVVTGLGTGLSPLFLTFAAPLVTILAAAGANQHFCMNPCETERNRRQEIRKQQEAALKAIDAGKSPLEPGIAGAFNPAADTVLDKDMQPMRPLQLKIKNRLQAWL
ncbi:MAG: hypothetical protein EPN97_13700 [Alphaproteobacteria bacterium]|nr:MAG: hypothetical protein EPN97_13700 [Alphaproteobacteria bacterium]